MRHINKSFCRAIPFVGKLFFCRLCSPSVHFKEMRYFIVHKKTVHGGEDGGTECTTYKCKFSSHAQENTTTRRKSMLYNKRHKYIYKQYCIN